MARRKRKSEDSTEDALKWYVLFGYSKSDIDTVGFYKSPDKVVEDCEDATWFPSQNVLSVQGYGTPSAWRDMINDDDTLNSGYEFHLVKMNRQRKP